MLMSIIAACRKTLKPHNAPEAPLHRHCLTFTLNGVLFGIDTRVVNEIARYRILAEPRGMPKFVRGLYRHNGEMIPVIDIAARYGTQPLHPGGRTCIVLVELGSGKWKRDVGIMVDEIFSVWEFGAAAGLPALEAAPKVLQREIIEGMVWREGRSLILLDAWRLLPDEELEELAGYMRQLLE